MTVDRSSGTFGGRLREARERRGITLPQIAHATKISIAALEALERNDISRLPGGIFSRAFVRAYALEVGLNPEDTIQDFIAQFPQDSITAGHPTLAELEDHDAIESERRIASNVVRLALVSIPIAAVVVYFSTAGTRPSQPADQSQRAATAGNANPARDPAADSPVSTPSQLPRESPPAAVSSPPAPGDRLMVGLSTVGRCWVSAIADGKRVIFRDMLPGEHQVVEVKRDLILRVGDAGAITTTFNGAPGRPLGKPGQVVTVQLNLTTFQTFVARP